MIKANELRIGNWVFENVANLKKGSYTLRHLKVDGNSIKSVESGAKLFSIPLTPEVLEKCGFENDNGEFLPKNINIDLIFCESENKGIWCAYNLAYAKTGSSDVGLNYPCLFPICEPFKYLHQLQNLYYALTGEELEYKP